MSPQTLRPGIHLTQIYVYQDSIDFRKGHKGIATLIEHELGHDVFSGALYVFRNRQCTRIKCLFWEGNGFVLYYKALAEEKFHWPQSDDELITLTGEQLNWLLDGFNVGLMKRHRTLHYESVA